MLVLDSPDFIPFVYYSCSVFCFLLAEEKQYLSRSSSLFLCFNLSFTHTSTHFTVFYHKLLYCRFLLEIAFQLWNIDVNNQVVFCAINRNKELTQTMKVQRNMTKESEWRTAHQSDTKTGDEEKKRWWSEIVFIFLGN